MKKKPKTALKIIAALLLSNLSTNIYAEATHRVTFTNQSLLPFDISVQYNSNQCIKSAYMVNQYGSKVSALSLQPGQTQQIIINDNNNSGFEHTCAGLQKSLNINLSGAGFTSPYSSNSSQNFTIYFQHWLNNSHWYSQFSSPQLGFITGKCQNGWCYTHTADHLLNDEEAETNAWFTIYNSTNWNQNFTTNLTTVNLSNSSLTITPNSDNNCSGATKNIQKLLEGGQSSSNIGLSSFVSSNGETPTNGKCIFNATADTTKSITTAFGAMAIYPQSNLNWQSISAGKTVLCANNAPDGSVVYTAESSAAACFQGCFPANPITNNFQATNGLTATPQYKYPSKSRKIRPKTDLLPIINNKSTLVSDRLDLATVLSCTNAANIDVQHVSQTATVLQSGSFKGAKALPYLLSDNGKYYFFCQVGSSSNNKLVMNIMQTASNKLIHREEVKIKYNPRIANGHLYISKNWGFFGYMSEEGENHYFDNLNVNPELPTRVDISNDGKLIYQDNKKRIFYSL
jgi:hypothetical protein